VQVVREVDWTLQYWVSDLAGKTTRVDPSDILHLRGPTWNGYLGMDAVQLAREAIGLAIATEETHSSLHANGAQPGGVLSVKGKLDEAARARLKAAWQGFYGGVKNRYKTAVLDVDADWKPLSMTGVDSQHLETRRFQIEEICRVMRVFPQMVMHSEKSSTFASAESFFLAHVTHSLMPWIRRWEEAIEKALFSDQPNICVQFKVKELTRGDSSQRGDYYMKALGGARGETAFMTRNEVRAEEGLDPIEGGDKLLIPAIAPPPAPGDGPAATSSAGYKLIERLVGLLETKYSPDQPRDYHGRFGSGGASQLYTPSTASAGQLLDRYGARDLAAHVEGKLALSTPTNASVASGGYVMANGEYTPERQAVHEAILKSVFNADAVARATPANGNPVLNVIGGRGGSGKSFITKAGGPVDSSTSILLDSDKFKAALPGYEGWNAALYHEEATHLLDKADAMATRLGVNVTHDATLKSEATSAARVAQYTASGYNTHGYYVYASPETAVGRALGRFVRGGGNGRYVPPDVILGNKDNEKNFDNMAKGFKYWQVYDNNGDKPRLVAQGGSK
jgi:HK97 family phage portal protein